MNVMNTPLIKAIKVNLNVELLFEFRSILFTIARYTNENYLHRTNPSQNFFNSLNFSTINGFIEAFLKEQENISQDESNGRGESYDKNYEILSNNIKNSKVFATIKPKLVSLSELYYLKEISDMAGLNFDLILFAKEKYYIEALRQAEIVNILNKILKVESEIKVEEYHNLIEKVEKNNETENDLNLFIDTNSGESKLLQKINLNNSLMFTKKLYKSSESNNNNHNDSLLSSTNFNQNKFFEKFEDFLKQISSNLSLNTEATITNYNTFLNNQFIYKYSNEFLTKDFAFLSLWKKTSFLPSTVPSPLKLESKVIAGFKRGSKLLGVPTANLEITQEISNLLSKIHTGVYYGHLNFLENSISSIDRSRSYKGVLSIGYNPYFDNQSKTIEVFLIDYEGEDFYDHKVSLTIQGFLRTEASFENFAELVTAISYDIITANGIL
jgi:riboflavin kinase